MPRKADAGETRIEGWVAVNLSGLPHQSGDEEGTLMVYKIKRSAEEWVKWCGVAGHARRATLIVHAPKQRRKRDAR